MALGKDYERRKFPTKKAATPIPRLISSTTIPAAPSSQYSSSTYSASANIETVTSLTPENTLSMVSTPWSTESWSTEESLYTSWLSTDELPGSSLTLKPATTSSYGASTPYHSGSRNTLTLFNDVLTPSASRHMVVMNRQPEYSGSVSTWTMESFTSTGILSDANILRVQYPWSPCSSLSGSELYPSSLESYESRKVSRVSVSGTPDERAPMTPMNYTFLMGQDKDPIVDWLLVKLKGLEVVDVRV